MIFSSLNQFNCSLLFLFIGITCGIIANLFSIIFLKKYQKNVIRIIFDSVFYVFFGILFIFSIVYFNFGIFSFTLLFMYILGIYWITILNHKIVVFFETKWYNHIKNKLSERKKRFSERKLRKSKACDIPSDPSSASTSRHPSIPTSINTQE